MFVWMKFRMLCSSVIFIVLPTSFSPHLPFPPLLLCSVENKEHSDFCLLRQMMIQSHMQDLKDITQEVHYENFRKKKLMQGDVSVK